MSKLTPEEVKELEAIRGTPAGKDLEAEIAKHTEGKDEQATAAFDDNLKRAQQHDALVKIVASAFAPGGDLFTTTGFGFLSTDPLVELGCKNFDLLIFNPKTKKAILVECKSSLASPGTAVADCRESEKAFHLNKASLEAAIGDNIVSVEVVLCVPAEITQKVARYLEETEKVAPAAGPKLKIWQVNKFEGQALQLFTLVPGRAKPFDSQHADGTLTRKLADGVKVAGLEVLIQFGPQSHPQEVGASIVATLVGTAKPGDTADPKRMRISDIVAYCSDQRNVAHYAAATVGPKIADRFIQEGKQLGLLKPDGKEHLLLAVDGKSLRTILTNYRREFRDRAIARSARRLAEEGGFRAFKQRYPGLGSYA